MEIFIVLLGHDYEGQEVVAVYDNFAAAEKLACSLTIEDGDDVTVKATTINERIHVSDFREVLRKRFRTMEYRRKAYDEARAKRINSDIALAITGIDTL